MTDVPQRRRALRMAALALLTALGATAAPAGAAVAADCPNAAVRLGLSAALPDCRAYEMVTPADKLLGVDLGGDLATRAAATDDGLHFGFKSYQPIIDSSNAYPQIFRSDRTAAGWRTETPDPSVADGTTDPVLFTDDLGVLEFTVRAYSSADQDVVPNLGFGTRDVYKIGADGSALFLSQGDLNPIGFYENGRVDAATSDGTDVVFSTPFAFLSADAGRSGGSGLYEGTPTGLRLVGVDDAGNPLTDGDVRFGSSASGLNAMSRDGSRIFFTASDGPTPGQPGLYVRENGQHTSPVPAAPAGANIHAAFLGASSDGSHVFFFTSDQLTPDDANPGADIYVDDLRTGDLTLLSAGDSGATRAAAPVFANADGSRAYFQVIGQLHPGEGAASGFNTYVWANGTARLVAPTQALGGAGLAGPQCSSAQMTADGRFLVFESADQLTPADQDSAVDVYRYDAVTGDLRLVSRGASGNHGAYLAARFNDSGNTNCDDQLVQSRHPVSDDGQTIFFQTTGQLAAADSNDQADVYEYDARTDSVHLISGGAGPRDSQLLAGTPSGDAVFFSTTDRLVSSDKDSMRDIYVARVNGGFPEPDSTPGCTDDACRPPAATSPTPPLIASIAFDGSGNASGGRKTPTVAPTLRILRRSIRGSRVAIRVTVSSPGRLSLRGTGLVTAGRHVAAAGTYALSTRLSLGSQRALRRHGHLRLRVRVGYVPDAGASRSVTLTIQVRK